jgi:hypothetical protein
MAAALALALLAAALASELDVPAAPYREAERRGAVGSVVARAMADPDRPGGAERPVAGVAVTLLPRSESLLARLAEIRRRGREDLAAYRRSASAITEASAALRDALGREGAADLVRSGETGAGGQVAFARVPAGRWILLAQRAAAVRRPGAPAGQRDRRTFRLEAPLQGYTAISTWVQELAIEPAADVTIELTDRNVWMVAIDERRG